MIRRRNARFDASWVPGSNSTLSAYRRRIAEKRSEQAIAPEPGTLDEKLLATVTQLMSQLSLDAAQIADDRVDEIQAEADQRIRIAEATMEKRLKDTALLEYRATTAEATVAEQRTTLTVKDEKLSQIEADFQASRESVTTLTLSLDDITRQLTIKNRQADVLEQALDKTRADNKMAIDQVQAELNSVQQALSQSQAELATATEQCAGLSTQLEERDRLIETHDQREQALQQRVERSTESREATRVQLEDLRQILSDVKNQLSVRDAELYAEKQAHLVSTERLKSAMKAVNDNEALIDQLQGALTNLAASRADKPSR